MKASDLADELDSLAADSFPLELALRLKGPDCDEVVEFRRRLRQFNLNLDSYRKVVSDEATASLLHTRGGGG